MAFLSWQNEPIRLELDYEPSGIGARASQLSVRAPAALKSELSEAISTIGASEIRIDLPDQYTVFIKKRESGLSRLLLAHPEQNEWVATLMLTDDMMRAWMDWDSSEYFQFSAGARKLDKFGNLAVNWSFFTV